jgi:ATP-dependent DNA helicase RecG
MLETLISQNEGKTLEFKENTKSLASIIKAVVAFANTSGGNIVIGVEDKDKKIVGVENPLLEEERLASAIADSVEPLIIPDIQIMSIRTKELLIIQVPHMAGPFYLKSVGIERGTYVRLGSTNRVADSETILSLQMLSKNILFDELPCLGARADDLDHEIIATWMAPKFTKFAKKNYESLGIVTGRNNKSVPTNGAVLLFAKNRFKWFPDSTILCVCFANETHEDIIDQQEIKLPLIKAHEEVLAFIKRNTRVAAKIHDGVREDIPQYPAKAVREALINSIVHADYSIKGATIQVAIFADRIEITNPGALTYGQTMELALSGISRMRNRMMGRIFREVSLIEKLGTGLKRIISVYDRIKAKPPMFQELNTHFRVTLYTTDLINTKIEDWQQILLSELSTRKELSPTEISKIWGVSTRTVRTRLNKMVESGGIIRVATAVKDPHAKFRIK